MSKTIIIEKQEEGYRVSYYGINADGSAKIVEYKNEDDLSKVLPVISQSANGLSKDSDRVTIFLNSDDTVSRVDHQVSSTNKDEAPQRALKQDEAAVVIDDFKREVNDKLGIPNPSKDE